MEYTAFENQNPLCSKESKEKALTPVTVTLAKSQPF
jgi:hypothetical protein